MSNTEGVIKFQLNHSLKPLGPGVSTVQLDSWRYILFRLRLIGQSPDRYDGYGYGNISERIGNHQFVISGTQTGHLERLKPQHFAVVEQASPESNRLSAYGLSKPSSEALTHAILYQLDARIGAVIHVHSPEIWCNCLALDLPCTSDNIAYGTLEMVMAVKQLFAEGQLSQTGIFGMLGHEDGIVAYGSDLPQAATLLIRRLAQAFAIEPK